MQLSPVKKRIKENKDHYIMADNYRGIRSVSWDKRVLVVARGDL